MWFVLKLKGALLNSLDDISKVVMQGVVPGEPPFVFSSSTMALEVYRNKAEALSGATIQSAGAQFGTPDLSGLLNGQDVDVKVRNIHLKSITKKLFQCFIVHHIINIIIHLFS